MMNLPKYIQIINLSRFDIAKFGFFQLKNFLFFGYGAGGFESLFQINYLELGNQYANHAHSDLFEFMGEFGLIGIILFFISLLSFFINRNSYSLINIVIMSYMIILLFFDFSLHIPLIQILFIIFFILNKKSLS